MRKWEYLRLSVCTWERRAKGWLDECLVILKNSFLSSGRGGKSNDRGGNRILLKERVTQSEGQVFTARKHQRVCTRYASDRWMTVRQGRVETRGNSLCASNRLHVLLLLCRQLLPGLSVNKRTCCRLDELFLSVSVCCSLFCFCFDFFYYVCWIKGWHAWHTVPVFCRMLKEKTSAAKSKQLDNSDCDCQRSIIAWRDLHTCVSVCVCLTHTHVRAVIIQSISPPSSPSLPFR